MTLTEILQQEFLDPIYASMTDQERFDYLIAKTITKALKIESSTIIFKLELENKWVLVNDLDGTEPYYDDAYHIKLVLETFNDFDMSKPDQVTVYERLVGFLVNNNILTQAQIDEITDSSYSFVSRESELSISNLTLQAVIDARV